MLLKLPPRIKVLEALSAIADGRIKQIDENKFVVKSSSGDKTYIVKVDIKEGFVCSTDNGTRFKKYIGYPIISALMIMKILPYNEKIAECLKGINWRELNSKFGRYYLVERYIKNLIFKKAKISSKEVDKFINTVINKLRNLRLRECQEC